MSYLVEFLDWVWEDTRAFVNLSIKSSDGSWRRSFAEWPRQREAVHNFIQKETAEGNEVFFSPSMWREKPQPKQPVSKDLFLGSHVLWAEFDGNAPEIASYIQAPVTRSTDDGGAIGSPDGPGASAATTGAARGTPDGHRVDGVPGVPAPSWVNKTSSSQHEHHYWKLDRFLTDPDLLENLNRTIASELSADNCWDATRVLRPPDTTNYGIGKPDREGKTYPVRVEEANDRRYPVQNFRQTPDFRPVIRSKMDDIPNIREVLAKHQWDDDFFKAFTEEPAYKKRSDVLQFLAYSAAESGFTDEEIYAVVRDADERWEKYTGRLDRDKWLLDHVERARTKFPLGVEELTFEGLLRTKHTEGREDTLEVIDSRTALILQEVLELNVKVDWLVKDLLPRGGYGIIAGPNGIGKSQMGIRLCEAVTEGTPFFERWKCKVPNAVTMFLSLEMEAAELKEFYINMKGYGSLFETGGNRFFTVPVGNSMYLDREEGLRFLETILEEHHPDLLVIDSLSVAMQGNFKDDTPVLAFNNIIKRIRKKYGVAVVVIHHNRKGQDKKYRYNELDDLYGSRFLTQDASLVLMVDKPKTLPIDRIAINIAKARFSKISGEFQVDHINMNFVNMTHEDDALLPSGPEKAANKARPKNIKTTEQTPKEKDGGDFG